MVGEYIDEFLGKGRYISFYIVNEFIGGLSADCKNGRVTEHFVPSTEIIRIAKEQGFYIYLAGGIWELVGKKGYGERVTPEEAERLVKKLREKRYEI
jgi:hypothetical protein